MWRKRLAVIFEKEIKVANGIEKVTAGKMQCYDAGRLISNIDRTVIPANLRQT